MRNTSTAAIVLKGGNVFGAEMVPDGTQADIAVMDGNITDPADVPCGVDVATLDCTGALVVPGLIDLHSHVYSDASHVGIPPDEGHLGRGVVAVVDAGTAGASSFQGLRKFIIEPARTRVFSYLNVSVLGLVDHRFGELMDPAALNADEIVDTASKHPELIRGLKIRLSTDVLGNDAVGFLERALQVADAARLRVMAHIGKTTDTIDEIVSLLRPGDIVTHCYTWKANGILRGGRVSPAVWDARQRGVLFDVGHGTTQLAYDVARAAIDEGFVPDTISSDLSANNWFGPAFDLATVCSKFVALGMPVADVIASVTRRPAEVLGITDDGYGSIRLGDRARITILRPLDVAEELPDAQGSQLSVHRFEPTHTIVGSDLLAAAPWRGRAKVDAP